MFSQLSIIIVVLKFTQGDITIFSLLNEVIIPTEVNELSTSTFLACGVQPPDATYTTRWITPNGTIVTPDKPGRLTVVEGTLNLDGRGFDGTALQLKNLLYQDEGVYICEARDVSIQESEWEQSASNLTLLATIQRIVRYQTIFPTTTTVALLCVMRDYIHPDEDFKWFKEDILLSPEINEKYSVIYLDGEAGKAQKGQDTLVPARVSVLTIFQPNAADAGLYTCKTDPKTSATMEIIASGFGNTTITTPMPEEIATPTEPITTSAPVAETPSTTQSDLFTTKATTNPLATEATTDPLATEATTDPLAIEATTDPLTTEDTTNSLNDETTTASFTTETTTNPLTTETIRDTQPTEATTDPITIDNIHTETTSDQTTITPLTTETITNTIPTDSLMTGNTDSTARETEDPHTTITTDALTTEITQTITAKTNNLDTTPTATDSLTSTTTDSSATDDLLTSTDTGVPVITENTTSSISITEASASTNTTVPKESPSSMATVTSAQQTIRWSHSTILLTVVTLLSQLK